jgi:hypothetical protein
VTRTDPIEIACALTPDDLGRQQHSWRSLADTALRTRTATEDGVRLEFDAEPATAHALLDLVRTERGCCGWASWTLVSTADATVVEVAAPGDGAAALRAMFLAAPPVDLELVGVDQDLQAPTSSRSAEG